VRRALLPLLALVGGVASGSVFVPAADAQQGEAGVQVEVEAGYDGRYLIGRRLPVRVSISADRLVRGAVEVTSDDLVGRWLLPLEVPGGSDKDVLVVVPTPSQFELRSLTVRVVGGGDPVVVDVEVEPLYAEELVGLLPELTAGDLPPPLALAMEAGTAHFVAVDDTTLAAPGALDPLGTLVAGPDELGRLDGRVRSAVLDWVDRGGRLVVDAPIGASVTGLPDAWQPGPTGRVPAGLGEVRAGDGAAAAGRWGDLLEPTPTVSLADLNRLQAFQFTQFESVGDSVARDAGLSALDLPWLLAFLGAYVALVGPIAWLALRRRRPALGWVVVPGLAVLFTGIAYVVGSDLRGGTRAAQGSIVEVSAAGARTTTVVGTVSRSGGDGRTRFPAGWTAGAVLDNLFFGGPFGDGGGVPDLTVTEGAEGAETEQPLAAGGFGVVRGTGPDTIEGGLTVAARTEGDEIVGTVRNDLPWPVARAAVFLGRAAEALGTLDPGEEVTFRFTGVEAPNGDVFSVGEGEVWREEVGMFGPPDVDSPVNLGLWNEVMAALGPNGRARGTVTAVGWTSSYRPPVDAVGDDAPTGRSAVVSRTPVLAGDDGSVARGGARRELVRGFDGVQLPDEDVDFQVEGLLWRLSLPPGTGAAPLRLDVPAYVARVELWDGTGWILVDDQLAGPRPFDPFSIDFTQARQVAVPAETVHDGAVWVRGWVAVEGPVSDGLGLELRTDRGV
jgi:hypothetical protein